ncbi:unnamed protein product [Urochloa humidicola]
MAARGEPARRRAGGREATRRRRDLAEWRRELTGWRHGTSLTATATVSAAFSPIPPAPVRIGEGEAPPSWDPVQTPKGSLKEQVNAPTLEVSHLA